MLRGLTTTNYVVDDLRAAIDWYTELLGVEPYFVREVDGATAYVEFRIGDSQHELGFIDRRFAPPHRTGSDTGTTLTYWAVDDVEATYERLLSLGATAHEGITARGPRLVTASVVDPFGNVLAVRYTQHYLALVHSGKAA